MTIVIFACSRQAYELMKKLEKSLRQQSDITIICKVKCGSLPDISEKGSLSDCVGEWFDRTDAFLFISAAGIAVRAIAPYIRHKSTDPAVLVMDEQGAFCISLLSGHAGGANALTGRIAGLSGAVPVITTATDREGKFAVDEFARRNQMAVMDWNLAKQVSVRILEGKKIGMYSELPFKGEMPEELLIYDTESKDLDEMVICISYRKISGIPGLGKMSSRNILQLVPQILVVGIGCRKGTPKERIGNAIACCLQEEGLLQEALCAVASIDLKKEEEGLLAYCKEKRLPFLTYASEELQQVKGEFSASAFVEEITGVACVCERSAVLAAEGRLLCHKKIYDGVTVALAVKKGKAEF